MKWYRSILIPTDGGESTRQAIEHGLALAKLLNADVTALSVIDPSNIASASQSLIASDRTFQVEGATAAVDEVIALAKELGVRASTEVRMGNPAQDIIEMSAKFDLIVMGTRGRTGLPHLLLGSVAEKVVRGAHCPVLVVRAGVTEEERQDPKRAEKILQ
jgi:nucleotide-binding universal stress UspA family protein